MQHEKDITEAMINGTGGQKGLKDYENVTIIGGNENPNRKGLVSFYVKDMPSIDIVSALKEAGIRVHVRKNDHYSGNILIPLNQDSCIRVSMCHYNSVKEVEEFLKQIKKII